MQIIARKLGSDPTFLAIGTGSAECGVSSSINGDRVRPGSGGFEIK
jgi:hypothetical protein